MGVGRRDNNPYLAGGLVLILIDVAAPVFGMPQRLARAESFGQYLELFVTPGKRLGRWILFLVLILGFEIPDALLYCFDHGVWHDEAPWRVKVGVTRLRHEARHAYGSLGSVKLSCRCEKSRKFVNGENRGK